MTITLNYQYASWLFTTLSKFIPKKPYMTIIESCVFEVHPKMVVVRATNIYDEIRIKLPQSEYGRSSNEEASFCVPVKELVDILKDCKGSSSVSITPVEDRLHITIDGMEQRIQTENPDEFPGKLAFASESIASYKVEKEYLYDALDKCYPFTCNDELRPAMNGVNFEFDSNDSSFKAIATNAHFICVKKHELSFVDKFNEKFSRTRVVDQVSEEFEDAEGNKQVKWTSIYSNPFISFILNRDMTMFFCYLFLKTKSKNKTAPVNITHYREGTLDMVDFLYQTESYGAIRIITRCIESRFPEYPAVIPDKKEVNAVVTVQSTALQNAIKKVKGAAEQKIGKVVFTFTEHFIELLAEDINLGKSATFKFQPLAARLNSEAKGNTTYVPGQPFQIAFNYKLLLTLLENFEEVDIYLFSATKGAAFYDRYDHSSMALLMPLLLEA